MVILQVMSYVSSWCQTILQGSLYKRFVLSNCNQEEQIVFFCAGASWQNSYCRFFTLGQWCSSSCQLWYYNGSCCIRRWRLLIARCFGRRRTVKVGGFVLWTIACLQCDSNIWTCGKKCKACLSLHILWRLSVHKHCTIMVNDELGRLFVMAIARTRTLWWANDRKHLRAKHTRRLDTPHVIVYTRQAQCGPHRTWLCHVHRYTHALFAHRVGRCTCLSIVRNSLCDRLPRLVSFLARDAGAHARHWYVWEV